MATPSLTRVVKNFKKVGFWQYWHQLQYIGDTKAGRYVGSDEHGNRFYENPEETMYRHRWVDYAQHDFNAAQVTPEWHSWLHHIRHDPPPVDPVMQASKRPWQLPHEDNLTGTRGAFKTYSTTAKKIREWEPTVAQRK